MKKVLTTLIVVMVAFAQSPVNVSEGPPPRSFTTLMSKDAGGRLEYVGLAFSIQNTTTFAVTCGGTSRCVGLTSIADVANTSTVTTAAAHGLAVGNLITISGETGDTDLNGTYYVQTVGATPFTTFTITTASVTDATYNGTALKFTTTAPRDTEPIWAIKKLTYDGTGFMTANQWAGGSQGHDFVWVDRAVSTGATKISYH